MINWWESLKTRERLLVAVVALVMGFVLLDLLLIEPLTSRSRQLDESLQQTREDLQWMQQAVQRLPKGEQGAGEVFSGRIVTYVDQQIRRQGLKEQMQQMTPVQDHSVRLRLQEIRFDKLIGFLANLNDAVLIEEVRILPAERQGHVNANLMVSTGNKPS